MSVLDLLKKGFGFVLMSMGVSRPTPKKPRPASEPKERGPEKAEQKN